MGLSQEELQKRRMEQVAQMRAAIRAGKRPIRGDLDMGNESLVQPLSGNGYHALQEPFKICGRIEDILLGQIRPASQCQTLPHISTAVPCSPEFSPHTPPCIPLPPLPSIPITYHKGRSSLQPRRNMSAPTGRTKITTITSAPSSPPRIPLPAIPTANKCFAVEPQSMSDDTGLKAAEARYCRPREISNTSLMEFERLLYISDTQKRAASEYEVERDDPGDYDRSDCVADDGLHVRVPKRIQRTRGGLVYEPSMLSSASQCGHDRKRWSKHGNSSQVQVSSSYSYDWPHMCPLIEV